MTAVLFKHIGPYHLARLVAASKRLELCCVELSGEDKEYSWAPVAKGGGLRWITVSVVEGSKLSRSDHRARRVWEALAGLRPSSLAIPGWSGSGALASLWWSLGGRAPAVLMSDSFAPSRRPLHTELVKRRLLTLFSSALVAGVPHSDYVHGLGMPRDRIFLGYDAVDNEYFGRGAEQIRNQKAESRNKYGLPENYFLASARFIPEKNLPALLKAYAAYRSKAESRKQKAEMLKEWEGQKVGRWESGKGQGENAEMLKAETLKEWEGGEVGRWEGGKGQGENAETLKAEMLKREDKPPASSLQPSASSPWHLVLLGDGPLRAELCRLISDLGLQDSVLLPGFKQYPDLPAYYGLANAFILPSVSETWGLVVNEAMASGLPVLVSNRCGCAPDLVQEGVNGWTFDPYNTDQLADLMLQLSQAPKQRLEEMGAASRRIIQDWGVERFAAGLKAAVDKALEVGPKRAGLFDRLLLRILMMRGGG